MANSIFAELQMVSQLNKENTVIDTRKQMNRIIEFFESRPDHDELQHIFAENVRNLKVETLNQAHGFMVQDDFNPNELPEELQHDSLGFCYGINCVFLGRYIYPVFDVKNDVQGWVGYDKFETPKYLDSKNHGYKAKAYSCYGMEKLPEYYRSDDIVIFTEGIVCTLYLRQESVQALAMLGSQITPYVLEIIKRFGKRAIVFMDADEAGLKLRKRLHYIAPEVRCVQSRVAKDIDDSRQVDPDIINEIKKLKDPFYKSPLLR